MASKKSSSTRAPAVPALSPLATRIAQTWRQAGETLSIERIASELGEVPRYDIVAALKELEKAGAGEFTVGHAGQKSRFVWTSTPLPRGQKAHLGSGAGDKSHASREAASGSLQAGRSAGGSGQGKAALDHVFHLRPGFIATVSLPSDVTRSEVERFCQFLQAIPFGGARGAAPKEPGAR